MGTNRPEKPNGDFLAFQRDGVPDGHVTTAFPEHLDEADRAVPLDYFLAGEAVVERGEELHHLRVVRLVLEGTKGTSSWSEQMALVVGLKAQGKW